jgi:hypothetical protein
MTHAKKREGAPRVVLVVGFFRCLGDLEPPRPGIAITSLIIWESGPGFGDGG